MVPAHALKLAEAAPSPLLPLLAKGVTLSQWDSSDQTTAQEIRSFCLAMVKEVYGFDYNPDWHQDLDSLLEGEASHYTAANRGCMFVLRSPQGEVIGTAGMRGLFWKPNMVEKFRERYGDCQQIASNWRMYIHPAYRGQGMGKSLVTLRELAAVNYGYHTMYLHCDIAALKLRNHWETLGFVNFANDIKTSHYDKPLA